MSFFYRFKTQPAPAPLAQAMQQMVEKANEIAAKAVERYRRDVAELGHTPGFEGELKTRIIGEAAAAVTFFAKHGIDRRGAAPTLVAHAVELTVAEHPEARERALPPELRAYGTMMMQLVASRRSCDAAL